MDKNKILDEVKSLMNDVVPEISTGDNGYHHSILINLVKVINLQQELLTNLIKENEN